MLNLLKQSVFVAMAALLAQPVRGQQPAAPEVIDWAFPLERAADLIQQVYARPVTYEDPMRVFPGEMERRGSLPNGLDFLVVKSHGFVLPKWPALTDVPALDLATVSNIVAAYEQQNPDEPGYRVIASRMGFHIVPVRAKDGTGRAAPAGSVLDTVVGVPVASRTASEHLAALCQAIANATAVPTDFWRSSFDRLYAANGYLLPQALTGAERQFMTFSWGTEGKSAREALIDLLAGSATTMTWRLHCGPDPRQNVNTCMLGLQPLAVGSTRVVVAYDHCVKCRPLPAQ